MYVPFFRSGRSQNSYLRLCVFLRFFSSIFFLPGVCKVDQQNACTSKIPIIAPQLSIPTSLTEGPRASTKAGGIHPVRQILHIQIRQGASARFPELRIHRGGRNRYGQQAVFCHVSSLTDIKFDTGSFLGKLFQAFAGS